MTPLAKKVKELFGKPELAAEQPAPVVRPTPEHRPFYGDGREDEPGVVNWDCPNCGQQAVIDDVFPSLDGERTLTMWSCEPCQVVAATPDAIRQPPTGWVPKTRQ